MINLVLHSYNRRPKRPASMAKREAKRDNAALSSSEVFTHILERHVRPGAQAPPALHGHLYRQLVYSSQLLQLFFSGEGRVGKGRGREGGREEERGRGI